MTKEGKTVVILFGMIVVVGGCQAPQGRPLHPLMKIETSLGNITLELDVEKAPLSVMNFADYARKGFYNGTIFHRVVANALIQGGAYTPDMSEKTEGLQEGIKNESGNGLSNTRGTIALVRAPARPNSTKAQFFINVFTNDSFDAATAGGSTAYTVFGKVVEGMNTVDRISRTPVGPHPKYAAGLLAVVPVEPVVIRDVRLLTPFDPKDAQAAAKDAEAEAERVVREAKEAKERAFRERIEGIENAHGKLTTTESGLRYVDIRVGTGPMPTIEDSVVIHCLATLADETEVENTLEGEPMTSDVKRMVKGVQDGLISMHEGGKRLMIVPADLAYGNRGIPGKVPVNSILFYEVDLLEVR